MLPGSMVSGLSHQAQAKGATLFMTLLTGFQALLYRYAGQENIRVGVPVPTATGRKPKAWWGFRQHPGTAQYVMWTP